MSDDCQSSEPPDAQDPMTDLATPWAASPGDLYALSLAIGVSLDPRSLGEGFLAALVPRLRLSYAAVWVKPAGPGGPDPAALVLLSEATGGSAADTRIPLKTCPPLGAGPWTWFDACTLDGDATARDANRFGTGAWMPIGDLGCLDLRRPSLALTASELSALLPLLARLGTCLGAAMRSSTPGPGPHTGQTGSNEGRCAAFVEQSADWFWILDTQGRHTYSNGRVSDLLGYPREQFLRADALDLVHPDDRPLFLRTFREAVERRTGWHHVLLRWRHRDGGYRVLESSASAVLDADGGLVEFQGVDRDITDRVEREQATRRLASIVEHSPDFIGVADLDGRIRAVNPAGRVLVGLETPADLETMAMLDFVHESSRASFLAEIVPAVMGAGRWQGEFNLRHLRTGAALPVLSDIFRIDGRDGQPLHIATVSQDIRERKRSAELLDRHNRLLRSVAAASAMLVTERSEQGMMSAICRILVEQGGYRMAWIGRVERDDARVLPVAWAGARTDYLVDIEVRSDESPQGQGPTGTAIRTGRSTVIDDVVSEPRFAP